MSINQAHSHDGNGVILFLGESMPFINLSLINVKQPFFRANYIEGKVCFEPYSNIEGDSLFSLTFKRGGAIEFGKALIELGKKIVEQRKHFVAPPYTLSGMNGAGLYYDCPSSAYLFPSDDAYFEFVPTHAAFDVPPTESLHQYSFPPPYPGAESNYFGSMNENHLNAIYVPGTGDLSNSNNTFVSCGHYFNEDPHSIFVIPHVPKEPNPVNTDALSNKLLDQCAKKNQ